MSVSTEAFIKYMRVLMFPAGNTKHTNGIGSLKRVSCYKESLLSLQLTPSLKSNSFSVMYVLKLEVNIVMCTLGS